MNNHLYIRMREEEEEQLKRNEGEINKYNNAARNFISWQEEFAIEKERDYRNKLTHNNTPGHEEEMRFRMEILRKYRDVQKVSILSSLEYTGVVPIPVYDKRVMDVRFEDGFLKYIKIKDFEEGQNAGISR